MANHVSTFITINGPSDIILYLKKFIVKDISNDMTWDGRINLSTLNLYSLLYEDWPTEDNAPSWPDREYMMNNISAKWCYLNDYYFDTSDTIIELYFESAWDAPESLIYRLVDHINHKFKDSEFEMNITSEDEGYNHVSGGYANQFGCEFYCDYNPPFEYPDPENYDDIEYDHDQALDDFYQEVEDHKMKLLIEAKEELKLYS